MDNRGRGGTVDFVKDVTSVANPCQYYLQKETLLMGKAQTLLTISRPPLILRAFRAITTHRRYSVSLNGLFQVSRVRLSFESLRLLSVDPRCRRGHERRWVIGSPGPFGGGLWGVRNW